MSVPQNIIPHAKRDDIQKYYRIDEGEIGEGAFSVVFSGTDIRNGRPVAIKAIEKKLNDDEGNTWQSFISLINFEIASLERTKECENVVELLNLFEDDTHVLLVFELILGQELFELICDRGAFPEDESAEIVWCVANAIKYCHSKNVIHRDIKPENIMAVLSEDQKPIVKLIDFGLSVVCEPGATCTEMVGSPGYVAPEILNELSYGPSVDMWSLGVTSYIILCGYPPWDDEDEIPVSDQIILAKYSLEEDGWEDISPIAKNFVTQLLVLDVDKRLDSTQAMEHPFISHFNKPTPIQTDIQPTPTISEKTIPQESEVPKINEVNNNNSVVTPSKTTPSKYLPYTVSPVSRFSLKLDSYRFATLSERKKRYEEACIAETELEVIPIQTPLEIICLYCGSKFPNTANFCGKCGKKLRNNSSSKLLPKYIPPDHINNIPVVKTVLFSPALEQQPIFPKKKVT